MRPVTPPAARTARGRGPTRGDISADRAAPAGRRSRVGAAVHGAQVQVFGAGRAETLAADGTRGAPLVQTHVVVQRPVTAVHLGAHGTDVLMAGCRPRRRHGRRAEKRCTNRALIVRLHR